MSDNVTSEAASGSHRSIADLSHAELGTLARELLLDGHLIDRAGMPFVIAMGLDVMTGIAIEEWMGASPVYTKRMQRLLGFEGDTVEVALKGMQLDIGAPPEFMDFRMAVEDDHHGSFHLAHCGALMDIEPMGDETVVAMCHHIEDPTFDATGWATNPKLRMRPVHRPPRAPADRTPHCAWTVTIDPEEEDTPTPERSLEIGRTNAAALPLAPIDGPSRRRVRRLRRAARRGPAGRRLLVTRCCEPSSTRSPCRVTCWCCRSPLPSRRRVTPPRRGRAGGQAAHRSGRRGGGPPRPGARAG